MRGRKENFFNTFSNLLNTILEGKSEAMERFEIIQKIDKFFIEVCTMHFQCTYAMSWMLILVLLAFLITGNELRITVY